MRFLLIIAIIGGLWYSYQHFSFRTYEYNGQAFLQNGFDEEAVNRPVQNNLAITKSFRKNRFRYDLVAEFHVQALVLSTQSYASDAGSLVSPLDLALGWGRLSNPAVANKLSITQSRRFYYYRWPDAPPLPPSEITSSSANMHLIPGNEAVFKALTKIRRGDTIRISGFLTNIYRDDGWRWRTSMTRHDSGHGACELLYVEKVEIL